MNLDFLNLALSQITHLVTNLTKKNYSLYVQQIRELIREYGFEADRHYLRCLFSYFEVGATHKESLQLQLLSEECSALLTKPALVSSICFSFDKTVNSKLFVNLQGAKPSNQLLLQFSKALKLSPIQEVVFAIALLDSSVPDTVSQATQFLKIKLPDLINSYVDADFNGTSTEGGLSDTTPEVLHLILRHAFSVIPDQLGIPQKTKEAFLKNLRRDFPRDLVPTVLAPLLYQDNSELSLDKLVAKSDSMSHNLAEGSMEEMVGDIANDLTRSVEICKGYLTQMCGRDLKPSDMASIIVLMLKSRPFEYWLETEGKKDVSDPSNPSLPWNVETLVQAVKDINSKFNWSEVMLELDQPEFIVKDKFGLHLVITTIRLGLQSQGYYQDRFPVEHIYRHWKHTDAQLSLITQILKNPEIFCFADYRYHPVAVDILKAPPETDNKDIASWHSLQLIEAILYLAERGHHYTQVQDLLKVPIMLCPDVLALGILQTCQHSNLSVIRQEILATLMPVFLANHPNSAVILQHAWHSQNLSIRQVIIHSMAEWYLRGDSDQSRLSRLLDVAQDLKALTFLLNCQTFPFVIDLACLASRRGYLKLEKWLSDKIREHEEPFINALIKFLQKRVPHIVSGLVKEDSIPKAAQLPHETLSTILICLQSCVGNVSQELSETIHGVVATCGIVVSKSSVGRVGVGNTPGVGVGSVGAPPVLRPGHRPALDTFTPSSVFSSQVDSLNTGLGAINLASATTSSAFTLPAGGGVIGNLGSLVSQPGSPSRLMAAAAASQSPAFPMMPLGPAPIVPAVHPSTVAARLLSNPSQQQPQTQTDKNRYSNFPKDIDDEANSYFQRIYNHPPHPTLSIDEVLDMLKKFMDSPKQRERDVFFCMLRNLFEEYKFFPQYPEKELLITAQLFGGIIERGLVTDYRELGMALRYVLDALRKPVESKMFYFGMTALDRFKTRLKDYPKYCEHIASVPNFSSFPPHLNECVEYGLQGSEPPTRSQNASILGPGISPATVVTTVPFKTLTQTTVTTTTTVAMTMTKSTPSIISSRPSIANATNIDTLLTATEKEDKMTEPPSSVQDKVGFIFNNLSQLNVQSKCDELKDIMTDEYWAWMAQYLVMKRASIEINFHNLYSNLLELIKVPELNRLVLRETFRNIRVLLRSDKGIENFSDRSLLKNLGHWLGMLTLGKNRPILQKDLDLKALLVEAYNKGQQELLYVVPFIAKVLESCAKSRAIITSGGIRYEDETNRKVFKPPNPWTMSIMSVLAELHQEQDLKLNLKFEIEVLCKNLSLDVSELKSVVYLKDPENVKIVDHQLSPPKSAIRSEVIVQQSTTPVSLTPGITMPQQQVQVQPTPVHPSVTHTPILDESRVTNSTPTLSTMSPPEPRFSYLALSVTNTASISNLITIPSQLQLFQTHPQLKQYVWPAVERAIQEWINPVVDRSVKIAFTATEQIIKKEFALEPDESKMRVAAHHMVRNLTAGMAMITCRDQLVLSIGNNLKGSFISSIHNPTEQQKSLIEQAATVCAQENMELACAYIQKTAIEKAVPEMDKHLHTEYERRKQARSEGRRYCDPNVLTYQAERMPELIRLKVGGVTPQQMVVYEDFARNIPGFQPLSDRDAALFLPKPVSYPGGGGDDMDSMLEKLISDLDHYQQTILNGQVLPQVHSLMELLQLTRKNRDSVSAISVIQKTLDCLFELSSHAANSSLDAETILRHRDMYIRIIKTFQDQRTFTAQFTNKHIIRYQLKRAITDSREDLRCNLEVLDILLRSGVLSMSQLDIHLAQAMENGQNFMAVNFAMQVVQSYLVDARNPVSDIDLYNTIEVLVRITNHNRQPPEGLASLIDVLRVNHSEQGLLMDRAPGGAIAHIHSGIHTVRSREFEDPPVLVEKTEFLLREWVAIHHSPQGSKEPNRAFTVFVHQLHSHGILKSDDLITRFFRLSMQMVVELCYRCLPEATGSATTSVRNKIFHTLDAYVKLIALLVKHSGDVNNTGLKINLLNKVLGIMAGVLQQDHETHHTEFQQLPYHRAFIMLFLELNTPDPVLESINFQVLTAYCHTLHILRPAKSPGFSYAWLELISHRLFLGRMLASHQQKCWTYYAQLLIDLFKYLAPFLRNAELAKPVTVIYKGTLRVLLVLLHDFPEFLCEYHYGFCDVIPPNCIQMRNLILSAFPRNMRLPDPFTPNLKVDMLPEISQAPRVLTNYTNTIQPLNFKKELDTYLKARAPVTFLSELRSNLQVSQEPGLRYNIQLMNALVLYVGTQAIAHIRNKGLAPNMSTIAHSAHMDIFQNLAVDLDTEGRYLFLNAIANQLRYPNSHTHYFSCTLLYLFAEANTEAIQEQITRVLLERLIVNRPHPWGLLITFIELIKNPTYKFWNHEFVHCAPEIEKLFESVARSCMVQKHIAPTADNDISELHNMTNQTTFPVA